MAEIENGIFHNEEANRFELTIKGQLSFIQYSRQGKNFLLEHTEVPSALEGHGIAKEMVEKTFTYLEENGLTMSPYCPYILTYLKRHPEWKRIEMNS